MSTMIINGTAITQEQLMILRRALINQICALSDLLIDQEASINNKVIFKFHRSRAFEVVQAIDGDNYSHMAKSLLIEHEDLSDEAVVSIDGVSLYHPHRLVIRMAVTTGQHECQEKEKKSQAKLATIAIVENMRFWRKLDKLAEIINVVSTQ